MRQISLVILCLAAAFGLGACSPEGSEGRGLPEQNTALVKTEKQSSEINGANDLISDTDHKILIAYFTWADNTAVVDQEAAVQSAMNHFEAMGDADRSGVDAISSASVVEPGNTAMLAAWIQAEIGGDLFSIQAEEAYPSDYDDCMDRALDEKAENARPALKTQVENFDEYQTIFIGFPNWWSSLPMPVMTFLESYDFAGKMVVPFCAHGTGGIAATVRELTNVLPETAQIKEPLGVYRADILQSQPAVQEWLLGLGFME